MGVKTEKDNSITISGFETIGQSPLSDFSDIMGVNVDEPGVAQINYKFEELYGRDEERDTQEFTVETSDNYIVVDKNVSIRGQFITRPFKVSSTGTLPSGLSANTVYYAGQGDPNRWGRAFKVATSNKNIQDGNYVNITNSGTGTHTIEFITMDKIIDITYNSYGRMMILSGDIYNSNPLVWQIDYGLPTLVTGHLSGAGYGYGVGLVSYKDYTLLFRTNGVDALLNQSGWSFNEPEWKNDFQNISMGGDEQVKPFFSLYDDVIYFYNGTDYRRSYRIGLLEEVKGKKFNPNDSTTFSFVEEALEIAHESYDTKPRAINEMGEYLIIATGGDKVYVWDKKSPSFNFFIELAEYGIIGMEVLNNIVYCIMNNGNIYATNLTNSERVFKMPKHLSNDEMKITAIAKQKNKILLGIKYSFGKKWDEYREKMYLASYNTKTGRFIKEGITSHGEEVSSRDWINQIDFIFTSRDNNDIMYLGTSHSTQDGVHIHRLETNYIRRSFDSGNEGFVGYQNYEAYVTTGLIPYGSVYDKKTLRNIEINLTRPLTKNQGYKIYYRRNDIEDFTLLETINFTTHGGYKDIKVEAPITDIIDLQIRVNMAGYDGDQYYSPDFKSPRLKAVRLIP